MSEPAKLLVACSGCGTHAPDGEAPGDWSYQLTARGATYLCPACVRDNIRSIEGKLDEAWW